MNIAQQLQKLLDANGISRSRLAREIGVHTSTVSNWLDGKEAKAENLAALCSFFGCTLDYLAGQMQAQKETAPAPEGERELPHAQYREVLAGQGVRILLDADAKVTEEQLDDIVEFIKFQQQKHGR